MTMAKREKAQSHKKAGIRWRVSESVFPADILADETLQKASVEVRGAWLWSLLQMWREKTFKVGGAVRDLAQLWACSPRVAVRIILEIKRLGIADVTLDVTLANGDKNSLETARVTLGNENVTEKTRNVTLVCRRLQRRHRKRIRTRERVKKHRCNANVQPEKGVPSTSISISSSSPTSSLEEVGERRGADRAAPPRPEGTRGGARADTETAAGEPPREYKLHENMPEGHPLRQFLEGGAA